MPFSRIVQSIVVPPHLKRTFFGHRSDRLRMLDVGCGCHAPAKTKEYFPLCEYHGIDFDDSSLDNRDRAFIKRFYCIDLDHDSLDTVPDEYFDVIIMSHVIEHLRRGLEVVSEMTRKLRPGGYIYIEFPGIRSLNVPRARRGFLHFHDDPTHVRVYTVPEVVNVLLSNRCMIVEAGIRRDPLRLLFTPLLLLRGLVQAGDIWSGRPWDLLGICEMVYAHKSIDEGGAH